MYFLKAPNVLEYQSLESFLEWRKDKKKKEKEERKQPKIDHFFKKIKKETNAFVESNDTSTCDPWIVTPRATKGLNISDKGLLKASKKFPESSSDLNADVNTVKSSEHLSMGDIHLSTSVFTVVTSVTKGNIGSNLNGDMATDSNSKTSEMVDTSLKVEDNMKMLFPDSYDKLCGPSHQDDMMDSHTDKQYMYCPDMADQICCIRDIKRKNIDDISNCVLSTKSAVHQEEKYCQTDTKCISVVEVQTEPLEISTQSLQTDVVETVNLEVQTEQIPTKSQYSQTSTVQTNTLECQTDFRDKTSKTILTCEAFLSNRFGFQCHHRG